MDPEEDSQATQQATQNLLDPRRLGKQNSGFSDEDIADIVCLLYPVTENASLEVQNIACSPEYSPHITGRHAADNVVSDLKKEDAAANFGRTRGIGDHAIVLKLSSRLKSPELGFTFGRNSARCDICFTNDPYRRLSNIHFRIYVNKHGVVMLEDQSTNGTIVDANLLRKPKPGGDETGKTMRMLESGSTIKIFMHENAMDLEFLVRIPLRVDDLETAYRINLAKYLRRFHKVDDLERTIGPGPGGHVNLFPKPMLTQERTQEHTPPPLPKEWRGGEKYNRVQQIGKGAFATVYMVTSKYDGLPYAAKELDKRKFMKNGVLDQKVENEMKIMQRVKHPNIVRYIEHFDWGTHQFFIVMEYIPGGDLGHIIQEKGPIKEQYVKIMAQQLIDALGYLHDNKITHRDVKPDNILIQSTNPLVVKLTDFGLSKMIDTEQTFLKTFCGTLLYCAPEVYSEYSTYDDHGRRVRPQQRRQANRERYDNAVDVWSLGGVLFYALTRSPPFPVKNGISYTELLHQIMTKPLDVRPLLKHEVSAEGVDFIRRMIDRRPETRATIEELQAHPWLNESDAARSFDEISDDELEQGASQLNLNDKQQQQQSQLVDASQMIDTEATEVLEPEPDYSIADFENKENYTFGQPPPRRLWGEVNNSAIGSSGAIPEDRLNIPMSGETEILVNPEILDSFESEDLSTPRLKPPNVHGIASSVATSQGNSRSIALNDGSQSLGGAESIMENLNMASWARNSKLRSGISDFNTSKRKPASDTSDESLSNSRLKPSFKRLKSREEEDNMAEEEDEISLLASVPQVDKTDSGRLIDDPVHKATFWDGADRKGWHLNYPEMTHRQKEAFDKAAKRRDETFGPGKTLLWNLAMKYFPPQNRPDLLSPGPDTEPWDHSSAVPVMTTEGEAESFPDTLPPDTQFPAVTQTNPSPPRMIARMTSPPGSVVRDVSISMTDPVLSWGRALDNTMIYQPINESRVPKYAFRIVLWGDGYNASFMNFRPWNPDRAQTASSVTMRASPKPDSYYFYISTKASNGIIINTNRLHPNAPKDSKAPSKYWMKLHHGDKIVFWGTNDVRNQAQLAFECFWGGSSVPRPLDEPPTCVPDAMARKLDEVWTKAEKKLYRDQAMAEATREREYRISHKEEEQERSRAFERDRAEAVKMVALRASRRNSSPAASPHAVGRTVPKFRHESPTAYLQSSG